ncbi:sensor histidine kinase [Lichenicola cladoniae]
MTTKQPVGARVRPAWLRSPVTGSPARRSIEPAAGPRRSRRNDILRSASLRLALVYALLFILSAIIFMCFIWWATVGLLEREAEAAIEADARALSERFAEDGLLGLGNTIQERLAQNVDDDAIYLMVDSAGVRVAGNLRDWPHVVARTDIWYQLSISRAGLRGRAELRAFTLPGGFRLLVGRDVRARTILKRLLTDTLLWAVLMVGVLGVSGAFVVRSLFRRMVHNVARTTAAIAAGDLTQRVPLSGSGDEFDRVAETVNEMLDRIARLMDGVKQVSNSIAHDLRTPITRARARLEDAALHATGDEEMRAAIERAVADLDGVTAVFEALLRIAEIEAGARRSAFAPLELSALLDDLADLYGALAEEQELTLERLPSPSITLQGDRRLIQQAVANLLDNAIKFSRPGGVVQLAAIPDAGLVRITVRDQGIGMQAPDLARASERFYRAETSRNMPGSGLGLSLVVAVAHLHGGRFELGPPAGRDGTTTGLEATLILPLTGMAGQQQPLLKQPVPLRMEPPSSSDHQPDRADRLS